MTEGLKMFLFCFALIWGMIAVSFLPLPPLIQGGIALTFGAGMLLWTVDTLF